jgi:hypothetical protein
MSKGAAAIAGVLAFSVLALAIYLWWSLGDVDMGFAGWAALIGGGLATLGLAGGLMALLFYSHNAGFDEGVGRPEAPRPPPVEKPRGNG